MDGKELLNDLNKLDGNLKSLRFLRHAVPLSDSHPKVRQQRLADTFLLLTGKLPTRQKRAPACCQVAISSNTATPQPGK